MGLQNDPPERPSLRGTLYENLGSDYKNRFLADMGMFFFNFFGLICSSFYAVSMEDFKPIVYSGKKGSQKR